MVPSGRLADIQTCFQRSLEARRSLTFPGTIDQSDIHRRLPKEGWSNTPAWISVQPICFPDGEHLTLVPAMSGIYDVYDPGWHLIEMAAVTVAE